MVSLSRKAQNWELHFAFMTFPYLVDLREVHSPWQESRLLNTHPRKKNKSVKCDSSVIPAFQICIANLEGTEEGKLKCRIGGITVSLQGWGFSFFSPYMQTKQQSCWSAVPSPHVEGMKLTIRTSSFYLKGAIRVLCWIDDTQILQLGPWQKKYIQTSLLNTSTSKSF